MLHVVSIGIISTYLYNKRAFIKSNIYLEAITSSRKTTRNSAL